MVKDKVVFVTGAASGIGKQIAESFLKNGAKVMFSDINQEALNNTITELQKKGYDCMSVKCDVTKEEEINHAIDKTVEKYGRLDILINNAGLQHVSMIEDFPTDKFEFMIKIMLTAPFIATKKAFPIMKKQGFGRIINMASINGVIGFAGKAAYNSAKHGLIGLTKVAALEAADSGITVNALCPGYVDTPLVRGQFNDLSKTRNIPLENVLEEVLYPLVPQKRLLDVQEIANYAMFLASDNAKGVTGQACLLDGGYTAQ
ncbi:3-hydroxybutyrate dehydrogenase [Clostridioides difficile]|mgnify:FL=1|uniref:3-hydroxybutyrate dehydrogenase n=1 Tax=Clostridioides difficile TaxID=1496 RepID=UPI00038CD027|nr:3-hydroxybutyrate dehydrogenase [Clostridioides difficile]AXB65566.1 3-hydroxybutyrate dehydrogenase [Clostridioides difficile]EGT3676417.1 3-hydroxybutyrate dehydrogenase [Clostridioides difficile]EGT3704667.1 3-hydroxybutyrate dehydrogenase [Clostridioides difficile]EGT3861234.1 3-hydroxybutyrate dehydrogenase [Clostridioides difficile]EGT4124368.1 3-hydroxybutyrate dehydrogenase [Clostridioides difficile]